jgi:hypothetical protein
VEEKDILNTAIYNRYMRWYARDQVCRNWRDAGEMENTASHIC